MLTLLRMLMPSSLSDASTPSSHGLLSLDTCPSVQRVYAQPRGTSTNAAEPAASIRVGGPRAASTARGVADGEEELQDVAARARALRTSLMWTGCDTAAQERQYKRKSAHVAVQNSSPHVPSPHICSPDSHSGCTTTVLWTLTRPLLRLATVKVIAKVPALLVLRPQYNSPTEAYGCGTATLAVTACVGRKGKVCIQSVAV